jgi:branched-subunit amino acid aminotransferase/4-amino-4-deoxychorismate lyase
VSAWEDAQVIELDGRTPELDELAALAVTGYACFTTMLVLDGRVRGLPLHLHRLAEDARTLFATDLDTDRVRALAARAGTGPVTVRVTLFDPALDRERPGRPGHPAVLVTTRPVPATPAAPPRLHTVRYVRDLAPVKHAGMLGPLHQRAQVQRAGYDDALFVDGAGHVLETPTASIGLLTGRELVFPLGSSLPSVTEALLRQVAGEAGLSTVERQVPVAELPTFPAAVVLNAVTGVRPVAAVDDHPTDPDAPAIAALQSVYLALPADPLLP